MLRTRLYLGLLPLLLLFIALGMASMWICRELGQSVEKRLVINYRLMLGGYAMRDAANLMASSIQQAQGGHILEAKAPFSEYKSRFQKNLMEQSFASADSARADAVAQVADAFDRLSDFGTQLFERGGNGSRHSFQESEDALFQTIKSLEDLSAHYYQDLMNEQQRLSRIVRRSINVVAGALVGGIL